MAGFLLVCLFLVCTCMCNVQVSVCEYEDIDIRWGIYHSLPSIFEAEHLCKPDNHQLVRLPSEPEDLSIAARSAPGIQMCPTVHDCYTWVLGLDLRSSDLH